LMNEISFTKLFSCSLLLFLFSNSAFSQEEKPQQQRHKFIGINANIDWLMCSAPNTDFIRRSVQAYNNYYDGGSTLTSTLQKESIGCSAELRSMNERFGFSGGLYYESTQGDLYSSSS